MVKETEGTHQIDDLPLYTKTWSPDTPPIAKLIFIHGYSDHINRYNAFFGALAARGIETHGFDQRGWGRSVYKPSEKGLTGPTSQVLSDIISFIKTQLPCPVPLFILGHSMGGNEVLSLASATQYDEVLRQIRGWLLEGPFLRFPKGQHPSKIKEVVGKMAAKFLPHFQLYEKIPSWKMTRNEEEAKSVDADELIHNTGTLEGLASFLTRAADADEGKVPLSKEIKSLWVGHGLGDLLCDPEGSRRWFDRQTQVEDKEYKGYEGAYHMLHAELKETSEQFFKDVADWILARSGQEGKMAGESKL